MAKEIDLGNIEKISKKKNNSILKKSFLKSEDTLYENQKKGKSSKVTNIKVSNNKREEITKDNKLKKEKITIIKKKKNIVSQGLIWFLYVLLFSIIGFIGIKVTTAIQDLNRAGIKTDLFSLGKEIILPEANPELYKSGDFTNFLLVGVDSRSAGGYSGLENTDSMIIVSYNYKTANTVMFSVPRDIYANFRVGKDNKTIVRDKINAAYYIAKEYDYPTGGLGLLRASLNELTGIDIQYTVQIDFQGFQQAIDAVGGIDINVENSFCDAGYPLPNDTGVETIKFYKGEQHMDGKTALKYARSRVHDECYNFDYSPLFEGNDYMRGRRQQKVIIATINKIKQTNFFADPQKIFDFIKILGDNVKLEKTQTFSSSVEPVEIKDMKAGLVMKDQITNFDASSIVLDPGINGTNTILCSNDSCHPSLTGFYIVPTAGIGKFDEVKRYVNFILGNPNLYKENMPGKDGEGNKNYAEVGFVDNGYGYTNTVNAAKALDKDFISSTYQTQLKNPLILKKADPAITGSTDQILTGVAIYDVSGKKPETINYLKERYKDLNPVVLTADQVPDSIKNIKGYDIILIFAK